MIGARSALRAKIPVHSLLAGRALGKRLEFTAFQSQLVFRKVHRQARRASRLALAFCAMADHHRRRLTRHFVSNRRALTVTLANRAHRSFSSQNCGLLAQHLTRK